MINVVKNTGKPNIRYVPFLPDLINPMDDLPLSGKKTIRFCIQTTDNGIEILGDSHDDTILDQLFTQAGVKEIERMLCG
jgi:hypothetical protein